MLSLAAYLTIGDLVSLKGHPIRCEGTATYHIADEPFYGATTHYSTKDAT